MAPPTNGKPAFLSADRKKFSFQHYWFDEEICEHWDQRLQHLRGQKLQVLEIGCFEGASTTWLLENFMSHPESTLTAIDTFEGGMEHQNGDKTGYYKLQSLEERFRTNVALCEHVKKLEVMKTTSDNALVKLKSLGARFDFIYIDASHVALDVLHDAVLSWRMLNTDGTMIFDDYTWKGFLQDCYNPRIAIQAFLYCAAPELESEEVASQLWVKKIPNCIPPTPNPDPATVYWDETAGLKL